jgi:hypothetical protein
VVPALVHEGARRIAWALLGPGAIVVGAALAIWGSRLRARLDSVPYGDLIWIALGTAVATSIIAAWATAIGSSRQVRPVRTTRRAAWILRPTAATFAGLLVPGLGLMMAGKRRLAAAAFWILGPMIAAALVLRQWRWISGRTDSSVPAALSGTVGEAVLAAAFLVFVLSLLAWIVQALDGARRVSWGRVGQPGVVSLALVLALGVFAATFRSHTFARSLDTQASALQAEGLRLIPWGFCEVAARLDPITPHYQVRAAELADELGMDSVASDRWQTLEQKSEEWLVARDALPRSGPKPAGVAAGFPGPLTAVAEVLPLGTRPGPTGASPPPSP